MATARSGIGASDLRKARQWMISSGVVLPTPDTDLVYSLRDGVLLCQLLLKLKPGCLSDGDWNPKPVMVLQYLKNVTAFLTVCRSELHFTDADLFSDGDLYDGGNRQKVLQCLSKLSNTKETIDLGLKPFEVRSVDSDVLPSSREVFSKAGTTESSYDPHTSLTTDSEPIFVTMEELHKQRKLKDLERKKLKETRSSSRGLPHHHSVLSSKDLHDYPWYVGKKSRLEAEQILHMMHDGVFLVRERANANQGEYAISVRYKGQTRHYKIEKTDSLMFYINTQHEFISVEELITFYQHNSTCIDIDLSYPVYDAIDLAKVTSNTHSEPEHWAEVVSTFSKTHQNELTIEKYDRIKLLTKITSKLGWWYGECKGKTGLFPSHCVREVEDGVAVSKEERHLKAFETALEEKGSLEQTIMHCLFFGHPRGGKSSLMKRLTGHPPNPKIPSTGVVEKVVQVEVRKMTTSAVVAMLSKWNLLGFDDEAIVLMATAAQSFAVKKILSLPAPLESTTTTETTSPASEEVTPPTGSEIAPTTPEVPVDTESSTSTDHEVPQEVTPAKLPEDYVPPMEILKQAIKRRGLEGAEQYLQGSLTLYLTDTGGQMEFQELLPALVAGPSVFFVVFRLDQDLNKTFTIEYLHPDGQSAEPYQSSFSVKETMFQSLASIASMGTYVYNKKLKKQVPLKPKVVLVGTHKDKVSPKKIAQIDRDLQQMVKATSLYREGLIEFASETRLVVTVNNLSPDDSDFQVIRSVVERIAERGDFKVSSPSTWLIFSLTIRQQKSRVITYMECFSIAQKCGINSHDELNDALRFLNTKVGLVRHFSGEGLEDLEEIVIIDPQILFDKITKLIVETFTFQKVTADVHEEFKRKGIFPLSVLEQLSSEDDEDQLLTVSRLVKLLEHLHIIARLHSDTEEVKFFMPCTLAHAGSTAPVLARPRSRFDRFKKLLFRSHKGKVMLSPSLLVTFECGYCPKGLFSALSVYLLANKMRSCLVWELQTNCIFKNSISLSVGPYDTMTLTLTPTYLEVSVIPADVEQDRKFPIEKTCTEVQQCISKAVQEVTSSLNYTSDAKFNLAFYCSGVHEGAEELHPAKIQFLPNGDPCSIRCEMTGENITCDLPKRYQHWFAEDSSTGKPFDPLYYLTQKQDSDTVDIDDEPLDSQHLLEITDYLQDLEKTDLYNLGLVLGLHRQRITDIRERCSYLEFCDNIVSYWLQRVDDVEAKNMVPSWRNLTKALKHSRVGQTGLADRIAKERLVPI